MARTTVDLANPVLWTVLVSDGKQLEPSSFARSARDNNTSFCVGVNERLQASAMTVMLMLCCGTPRRSHRLTLLLSPECRLLKFLESHAGLLIQPSQNFLLEQNDTGAAFPKWNLSAGYHLAGRSLGSSDELGSPVNVDHCLICHSTLKPHIRFLDPQPHLALSVWKATPGSGNMSAICKR